MMAKREDIELRYRADISHLVAKLGSIPGITEKEAKAMAKALDKGFRKATASANKAAKASRKQWKRTGTQVNSTTEALGSLQDAAGDSDSSIMGLAGGLDMLSPRLGDAASVAGDLGAALESTVRIVKSGSPVLLAVTIAAAAAAAAYSMWKEEQAAHQAVVEASTSALKTHRDQVARLVTAQEALAVTLGEMTRTERDLNQMRRSEWSKIAPMVQDITEQITLQGREVDQAKEAWDRANESLVDTTELTERELKQKANLISTSQFYAKIAKDRYDKEDALLSRLDQRRQAIIDSSAGIVDAYADELIGARLIADATEGAAQVERERAEAARELAERAAKAKAAAVQKQAALEAEIEAQRELNLIRKVGASEMTQAEADLIRATDARIARIIQLGEEANEQDQASADALQAAINGQHAMADLKQKHQADEIEAQQKLQAAHDDRSAERAAKDKAAHDDRIAQAQEEALIIADSTAAILGSMSQLADMTSSEHERKADEALAHADELRESGDIAAANSAAKQARAHQAAATQAFNRSQGLAATEVVISTATGIAKAWAEAAGNPVIALPLSAAVAAAGMVQLAAINAQQPPSFHSGGVMPSDSRGALLRAGEGVLSQQGVAAVGGAQGVNQINRGMTQPQVVMVPFYKHLGSWQADELRRPGSPSRQAITRAGSRSTPPGRRRY